MFTVSFPAKQISFENPITVYDAAKEAELISREVIACAVDGKMVDLTHVIEADANVALYTFDSKEGKKVFWHTASHVLAQAVKRLFTSGTPLLTCWPRP